MKSHDYKNLVVMIVDMQDFFLKKFESNIRKTLLANQSKVIDFCVKKKMPFVVLEYRAGGVSRGQTTQSILEKINSSQSVTIIKNNNSGFTNTNLGEVLENLKCKKILLMGVNANGCVQDTAMGAINRNYTVLTSRGIIASTSRKDMNFSKNNLNWYAKNTNFFDSVDDLVNSI